MGKKKSKDSINIVMACKGSIDIIRSNGEKGSKAVFYCPNFDDKILLVDNLKKYKEIFFNTWEEFDDYVKENY